MNQINILSLSGRLRKKKITNMMCKILLCTTSKINPALLFPLFILIAKFSSFIWKGKG